MEPSMRKYIRHPLDIPIEYKISGESFQTRENSRNISIGGICFCVEEYIVPETILFVRIPTINPDFEAIGRVVWCLRRQGCIEVGVEFMNDEDAMHMRLIEQISYIKSYQNEVQQKEGRELSDEEATTEWTRKFSRKFPII